MTNQDERTLMAGLRALKEQSAGDGASEHVHAAVISEFRGRHQSPKMASWWWRVGAAFAAACAAIVFIATHARGPVQQRITVEAQRKPLVAPFERSEASPPRITTARVHRRTPRRPAVPPAMEAAQHMTTEFISVVSAPPLVRGEHAAIMRVELPRSSLRAFGFPIAEEQRYQRVNADVVVGQDGLIRAVRFVR